MELYTIGHSNQSVEDLYNSLRIFNINCIVDIRSMPYSKYTPQFNKESLSAFLNANNILYAHFGKEFGARRFDCVKETKIHKRNKTEIKCQVNFEDGINTTEFQNGVQRIKNAMDQGFKVCLMCSEANPIDCHRFSFIARYFYDNGWNVLHITKMMNSETTELKPHNLLEDKMITDYILQKKIDVADGQDSGLLFPINYSKEQQRIDAYRLKNSEIGYCPSEEESEY